MNGLPYTSKISAPPNPIVAAYCVRINMIASSTGGLQA